MNGLGSGEFKKEYVVPHFQRLNLHREALWDWQHLQHLIGSEQRV